MHKRGKDRFSSTTGLSDLLFNLLIGFVFLFVVAFLLINPPTKKEDAPKKAEYLIIIEWQDNANDDVDLWVKDPRGITVSFTNKTGGLLNLEKDDLGASNDKWQKPDGTIVTIPINREVITMRGIVPGRYQVAAHIYSRKVPMYTNSSDAEAALNAVRDTDGLITATLVKINPYGEVYTRLRTYQVKGQVFTLFNFELDVDGKVIAIDESENNIIVRGGSQ